MKRHRGVGIGDQLNYNFVDREKGSRLTLPDAGQNFGAPNFDLEHHSFQPLSVNL